VFSLSPIKILIIVALILVVMGPDKLPEVAKTLGNAWNSLRSLREKIESEVRDVVPDLPSGSDIVRMARNPVNILNSLADRITEPPSPTVVLSNGESLEMPESSPPSSEAPSLSIPAAANRGYDKETSEPVYSDPSLN
jgi:TatA/E family protein of Tat protein translocase